MPQIFFSPEKKCLEFFKILNISKRKCSIWNKNCFFLLRLKVKKNTKKGKRRTKRRTGTETRSCSLVSETDLKHHHEVFALLYQLLDHRLLITFTLGRQRWAIDISARENKIIIILLLSRENETFSYSHTERQSESESNAEIKTKTKNEQK